MPPPAQRSKAPVLSRQKVLTKAIKLADKNGIEGLSMRKLADALNVEAMSLYNHVKNKEELIDGMVDQVVKTFHSPSVENDWKQSMRECAVSTHTTLLKHPWAAQLLISRVTIGDSMLGYSDKCFGCLHEAGFSYEMADHGWNAISNHIYGFTLTIVSSPIKAEEYAKAAKQYLPMVPKDQYPHIHSMMQLIIAGKHTGINNFEFGLDLILDGLERLLPRTG